MRKALLLALVGLVGFMVALALRRSPPEQVEPARQMAPPEARHAKAVSRPRTTGPKLLDAPSPPVHRVAVAPSSASRGFVADPERSLARTLSPLRAPVIDAIRGPARGEQKRRAMLDAIRSSGESDEEWTAEAEGAFDTWTQAMPKEHRGHMTITEPLCYAAGCIAEVTFPDAASHRAAASAFRTMVESNAGHGGRVQTPPESRGNAVVASWIMLRPTEE